MAPANDATFVTRRSLLVVGAALILLLALLVGRTALAADLPPAGGLQSLPEQRTEPVSLTNAGFEDGLTGWQPPEPAAFSVVQARAREGDACLRFDAATATRFVPSVRQSLPDTVPGIYAARFWVRTQDITPPEGGQSGVRVSVEYRLKDGQRRWPSTEIFHGTADWRQIELRVLIPTDLEPGSVTLKIGRYGGATSGEAFFDDVTLERVVPPPVEAFLLYPNYRGYLPEDGPGSVRVWLRVNEPSPTGPARIEVTATDGNEPIASASLRAETRQQIVELDASQWPVGSYLLRARLGSYEYPPYLIRKISADERRRLGVWFDALNVLHLDGKPAFPIGFYNTVLQFPTIDDGEIARLDKMAEAPTNFHINYTWWPSTLETRRYYLAEMHKRGIWYLDTLMPFKPGKVGLAPDQFPICQELLPSAGGKLDTQDKCDQFLSSLAQQMRQMPGHAGWYVMDERPFSMVPAIFHQYSVLRRADPDHP
ncbi:MAG: hypothetical protein ACE5JM_05550, partial [Armatimonadota bacterium]